MSEGTNSMFPYHSGLCLSEIRNIPLSAWWGHGPFALWLVDTMRPASIVELGTYFGFSFFTFCQGMSDLGLSGTVSAVDTWKGDDHAGLYGDEVYTSVKSVSDQQFPSISNLLRMTFDEAASQFEDGSIDILHIDGLHTHEAVAHDYETWRRKVKPGGVILFHDICERKEDFGVWKLWDELAASNPSFAFHHSHGLGVLGVGDAFTDGLRQLLDLEEGSPQADVIRQLFSQLGERLVLRDRIKALETQEAHLRTTLARMEASRSWRITAPLRSIFRK